MKKLNLFLCFHKTLLIFTYPTSFQKHMLNDAFYGFFQNFFLIDENFSSILHIIYLQINYFSKIIQIKS